MLSAPADRRRNSFLAESSGSQLLTFVAEPISSYVYPPTGRTVFKCQTKPASSRVSWTLNGQPILTPGGSVDSRWHLRQAHHKLTVSLNHGVQDPAYFQCLASYRGQTLVSNPAKFILAGMSNLQGWKKCPVAVFEEFPAQPDLHLTVRAGNLAVVPCVPPHGVPTIYTEFLFNGSTISHSTGRYLLLPSGNLHISKVQAADSGEYRCQGYNPYMNERKLAKHSVFLTVIEPSTPAEAQLTVQLPMKTRAVLGSNVTLECAAEGNPPPDIRWTRKDSSLPTGRHYMLGSKWQL
ncbi:hypothetical protein LAZ67_19002753 [Cordylochernes scorpioides]|uniref:Ig-like domain-containing protein n=1 Tax=Cordylochernes scorpioides TaxID=51811 RepID=A0ABY6LLN3_9ARAC|nr:hypothetical protein LAZ67_19002753 [Cordylochernes scorpioides]